MVTIVRPANSVRPQVVQTSQGMSLTPSRKPASSMIQIKPATSAAPAGLGRPWKKRLSTMPMLVLKRARRSAAPAM